MDLRLSIELFNRLGDAAKKWNTTKSSIVRKAEKKWDRFGIKLPVELFEDKKSSTCNLLSIKIRNFKTDKEPEEMRQIIIWYLNDQDAKEREAAPLDLDTCKEGLQIVPLAQY